MIIGMMFEHDKEAILADGRYNLLESKLLAIGGKRLVYMPTPLLDEIVAQGFLFEYDQIGIVSGLPNDCHENALKVVKSYPETCRLAHGFGLSEDGLWRNHSWVMREKSLIETTVPRIKYYGIFELTN